MRITYKGYKHLYQGEVKQYEYYINNKLYDYEKADKIGWSLTHRESYLEDLFRIYSDMLQSREEHFFKQAPLVLKDIKKLLKEKCKYIFISLSNNRFLTPKHKSFEKVALKFIGDK